MLGLVVHLLEPMGAVRTSELHILVLQLPGEVMVHVEQVEAGVLVEEVLMVVLVGKAL